MSEVKITDAGLEAALRGAKNGVTLKGADGRILGIYTPINDPALQPRISEEEIQRRLADAKSGKTITLSTQEVLAKLRAL